MTYIIDDVYIPSNSLAEEVICIFNLYIQKMKDFIKNTIDIFKGIPRHLIRKTLFFTSCIVGAMVVIAIIGVVSLLAVDNRSAAPPPIPPTPAPAENEYTQTEYEEQNEDLQDIDEDEDETNNDDGGILRPPARTNFLLLGIDHNNLTDAIMVGCFYRDTGDIKLMSIPRDMYTRLPAHRLEQMRAEGLRPPNTMKINAVRAFGGRNGTYYLKQQLGEMLGVEFHYYVEVRLDAFVRIIDAMDGILIDIPVPMYYNPPDQDLFINLSPGLQRLDGRTAEGLVRFRGFPTGDLGRNQTHMDFMSQLISQLITREALMADPLEMINIVLNDVSTNASLGVLRYIPYIHSISADSIQTYTMPGNPAYFGGVSWFMPDTQKVPDVINQIFYAEIRRDDDE